MLPHTFNFQVLVPGETSSLGTGDSPVRAELKFDILGPKTTDSSESHGSIRWRDGNFPAVGFNAVCLSHVLCFLGDRCVEH